MEKQTQPVFFDRTGNRSLALFAGIGLALVVLLTLVFLLVPTTLSPESSASVGVQLAGSEDTVEKVTDYTATNNIPVIGDGPFVRVVQLNSIDGKLRSRDPFDGQTYGELAQKDVSAASGHRYALQKFGQTNSKKIALTYDDGPDPIYSPQLLDLLSRERVPATFFVLGVNVVRHPEIAERMVREGHMLGNHSFSHINFGLENRFRGTEEIIQAGRVIRATTGHTTKLFRTPYIGESDQSLRDNVFSIVSAQRLGYVEGHYSDDPQDWQFNDPRHSPTYPDFSGAKDIVVLLHDGGGNREKTIAYTEDIIKKAREHGYAFTTMEPMATDHLPGAFAATNPDINDEIALTAARGVTVWPQRIIVELFVFSVATILLTTAVNTYFAWRNLRAPKLRINRRYSPRVGVIVPAYNEGIVLEKTIRALRASSYRNLEIVMVDDGSTDDTWQIMQRIVRRYRRGIVRAIHQKNTGKSGALNHAIASLDTDIIICLDADTLFERQTIAHLVKHFALPQVGAVAGVVKVGNARGYVTRWQALEYTIGIALERNAQNFLGAITIVPGACGAWRRQAVIDAGGFSHRTLAEDCDLTFAIHQLGYRVVQENEALSYTEAPETLRGLMKQRFRWTFGNFQALWSYRNMLLDRHYKMLGNFVMPMMAVTIITPMIFWPLLVAITIQNIINGNILIIVIFFIASLIVQVIFASAAIRFADESYRLLWVLPLSRFVFGPIRTYIMYRSLVVAFSGRYVGWNKLMRSGTAAIAEAPSSKHLHTATN